MSQIHPHPPPKTQIRVSGKSYLGFPCANCRQPLVALTIVPEIETPRFNTDHSVVLPCRACGHEQQYPLNKIVRYEEHQLH